MGKREEIEDMYRQLQWLVDEGDVPSPYSGNLMDEGGSVSEDVLGDFLILLTQIYPDDTPMPEWAFMFVQIYSWQYQAQYEGVDTYYTNLYDSDLEDSISRLSDSLHLHGYSEMAKWYDYGIFDYKLYSNDFSPNEQGVREGEVEEWLNEHEEDLWHIYQELLFGNKEELMNEVVKREECEKVDKSGDLKHSEQEASGDVEETGQEQTENAEKTGWKPKFDSYIDASLLINDKMISQLVTAKEVKRIQTAEYLPKETCKLLDQKIYSVRDDIQFRIFSYEAEKIFDLRYFEEMLHVQSLNIGIVKDVEHTEVLSQLENLKYLWLHLEKRQDYRFVNDLSEGITELSITIGEDVKECTFGDAGAYEMEWLLRFSNLQACYMGNCKKNLQLLTRVDSVRELRLYNVPCPSLKVLKQLNIGKVVVHREQAEGLEVLGEVSSLQEIELVKIADLQNLDFISKLHDLQKIVLRGLPEVTSLPQFPRGQGVSEIEVYDCGKLSDVSAVKGMPHLRKLRLYSVEAAEETVKEAVSGLSVILQYYD